MNIAVIPARGGSKRIPRKNIKLFCGKPIIAWAIETAQTSKLFDQIIVSTDDDEIRDIAISYGAEVPFIRPKDLSDDYSGTTEVITHAVQWIQTNNLSPEAVCCIYATNPFLQADEIKEGLEKLRTNRYSYVISATEFAAPIYRSFTDNNKDGVEMVFPQHFYSRSQDLPPTFHDAGQFYWAKPSTWLNKERIFSDKTGLIKLPRWRVQDIDTLEDWKRAEVIYQLIKAGYEQ
jgi:pseudaminic acid cytidylyltransferase